MGKGWGSGKTTAVAIAAVDEQKHRHHFAANLSVLTHEGYLFFGLLTCAAAFHLSPTTPLPANA